MYKWRIYYDDGSTFDNTMGEPEQAPAYGVQIINRNHDENGAMLVHHWDFYYWKEGKGWFGGDIFGLLDQLLHDNENKIRAVKQGRTLIPDDFKSILNKAHNDPDFFYGGIQEIIDDQYAFISKKNGDR
jgi:hypothetical protein